MSGSTTGIVKRGLLAGAAGTTLLNAVTYLDMAIRGRPSSGTPERTVDTLLGAIGQAVPGEGKERDSRRTGLGALSGIASGLGIGVAASALRAGGLRLPGPLGWAATGAGAMAATNAPMALAGISDPREWSTSDWISDAIPHLAYGIGAHAVLVATDQPSRRTAAKSSPQLLLRAFTLGTATGIRSSLGAAGPVLFGSTKASSVGRAARALAVGGELVADKLPQTPSRLQPPALAARAASGATGAVTLARRERFPARPVVPSAIAGMVGAVVGSYGGAAWRRWAATKGPDWRGALLEDGVGLGLAYAACRKR